MAKLSSGILGPIRGKVGDKVYYVKNGKQCVRGIPKKKSSGPSEAQLIQQAKMAKVIGFVNSLKELIVISYRHYKKHITPFNGVVRDTLLHAVNGSYPNFNIDYSKVQVSRGNLPRSSILLASAESGEINFLWNAAHAHQYGHDKAILVAYCEALNKCTFTTAGPCRKTGKASLSVPDFHGQLVHTWLSFLSADGKDVADSFYTGAVRVI